MARIETYVLDTVLNASDKLIGTDAAQGANNATKNFTVGTLKEFINTGIPDPTGPTDTANQGYVADNVVNGGSISGGNLILTRTGELADVTITGVGQVQSLETVGTSGAATLTNGVLNIPQYSGGAVTGAWQTLNRTFTGSELVNAFNGNATDKITLVTVPSGHFGIIQQYQIIIKCGTTGTTDYNATESLYVGPESTVYLWAARIPEIVLNSSGNDDRIGIYSQTNLNFAGFISQRPSGADIILGIPTGQPSVNITAGDREVVIQLVYRITSF